MVLALACGRAAFDPGLAGCPLSRRAGALLFAAAPAARAQSASSFYEAVSTNGALATLKAAIDAAGLTDALSDPTAAYTVFAPTNAVSSFCRGMVCDWSAGACQQAAPEGCCAQPCIAFWCAPRCYGLHCLPPPALRAPASHGAMLHQRAIQALANAAAHLSSVLPLFL